MGRVVAGLIAAALLLLATTGWADGFKYRIPEGFTDLSPGAPAENFAKVPAAVAEQARQFRGSAVFLKDGEPPVAFFVMVKKGYASVGELADEIAEAVPKRTDVTNPRVVANEKVSIGGFECAKIEYVVTAQGLEFTKLFYILPVGPERAMMSLDGPSEALAKARPAFEASVKGVSGLAHPSGSRPLGEWGVIAGAILLAGAVLMQILKRSRNEKSAGDSAREKRARS